LKTARWPNGLVATRRRNWLVDVLEHIDCYDALNQRLRLGLESGEVHEATLWLNGTSVAHSELTIVDVQT
jgi:hypothetical protein